MYASASPVATMIEAKANTKKKYCVAWSSIVVITIIILSIIVIAVAVTFSNSTKEPAVSFKLHVNPSDPVILSAETPEGDVIYMLGNKSETGVPQSIDEFQVENDEKTTFISMNDDGTIGSALDSNGMQIDLFWDENQTTVHVSVVLNNGSEQLSVNIDLTEPVGENFTDFSDQQTDSNSASPLKRGLHNTQRLPEDSKSQSSTRIKRQSDTQTYASVFIVAESCGEPESNAKVFADVRLDYDQKSQSYERLERYLGRKTSGLGEYEVRIPTSSASNIGEKTGEICEEIEMFLANVCDFYSKANKISRFWSGHDVDSVFCFLLGNGLRLAFPALRLVPVFRFCKNIFKPLKWYCNKANKDIPFTDTSPVDLLCDSLPHVDNGVDFFREKDVLFTPSAIFPRGNLVALDGQVLVIPPGTSIVPTRFTVVDDQTQLQITHFSVNPFDPVPFQDYLVVAEYNCYSSSSLFVQMSIVGTDSYTDFTICYTGPYCYLHVPGAEALVRDDVDVFVQDSTSSISRKVTIIF